MADDIAVDDDESKIVTNFLLDTCRLRQPSRHHLGAAALCAKAAMHQLNNDDKSVFIPITSGSVAEFYIQPMLSCVGDIDIMTHLTTKLAIPAGYLPPLRLPAEFHSRVKVYEIIDSKYPGYVYLVKSYVLTKDTDSDAYDAERYINIALGHLCTVIEMKIHGPAWSVHDTESKLSLDSVLCIRCLSWPTQASDWPTRHRNQSWPDSATVRRVVSNGRDVVRVAHPVSYTHLTLPTKRIV